MLKKKTVKAREEREFVKVWCYFSSDLLMIVI